MKKSDYFMIEHMIELCDDIFYLKNRFGESYEDLISDKAYIFNNYVLIFHAFLMGH